MFGAIKELFVSPRHAVTKNIFVDLNKDEMTCEKDAQPQPEVSMKMDAELKGPSKTKVGDNLMSKILDRVFKEPPHEGGVVEGQGSASNLKLQDPKETGKGEKTGWLSSGLLWLPKSLDQSGRRLNRGWGNIRGSGADGGNGKSSLEMDLERSESRSASAYILPGGANDLKAALTPCGYPGPESGVCPRHGYAMGPMGPMGAMNPMGPMGPMHAMGAMDPRSGAGGMPGMAPMAGFPYIDALDGTLTDSNALFDLRARRRGGDNYGAPDYDRHYHRHRSSSPHSDRFDPRARPGAENRYDMRSQCDEREARERRQDAERYGRSQPDHRHHRHRSSSPRSDRFNPRPRQGEENRHDMRRQCDEREARERRRDDEGYGRSQPDQRRHRHRSASPRSDRFDPRARQGAADRHDPGRHGHDSERDADQRKNLCAQKSSRELGGSSIHELYASQQPRYAEQARQYSQDARQRPQQGRQYPQQGRQYPQPSRCAQQAADCPHASGAPRLSGSGQFSKCAQKRCPGSFGAGEKIGKDEDQKRNGLQKNMACNVNPPQKKRAKAHC